MANWDPTVPGPGAPIPPIESLRPVEWLTAFQVDTGCVAGDDGGPYTQPPRPSRTLIRSNADGNIDFGAFGAVDGCTGTWADGVVTCPPWGEGGSPVILTGTGDGTRLEVEGGWRSIDCTTTFLVDLDTAWPGTTAIRRLPARGASTLYSLTPESVELPEVTGFNLSNGDCREGPGVALLVEGSDVPLDAVSQRPWRVLGVPEADGVRANGDTLQLLETIGYYGQYPGSHTRGWQSYLEVACSMRARRIEP